MEGEEWDSEKLEKTMTESKQEFIDLQKRLVNLMVDFGVRALKTFQAGKTGDLNPIQINQIVAYEIGGVKHDLSNPELIQIVIERAERAFHKTLEQTGKRD